MNLKEEIIKKISMELMMDFQSIENILEIPPELQMGDYALPCFQLAKRFKKSPNLIASELGKKITCNETVEKVEIVGGYVNIFLNKEKFIRETLLNIVKAGEKYGSSMIGNGKTVVVEFSSPNIAKPFHVGHMCSTVIGNSIERLYKYLGHKTVRINHLGDWGTQFGKLISAYKHWGNEEELKHNPIKELLRIYVQFHDEAKNNPELEDEARIYFKKLEEQDSQTVLLWEKFREVSLNEFKRVYDTLGIEFDSYAGESFYSDKINEVVEIFDKEGLLRESENAKVVSLDEFSLPPCLIIKSDGATIYASRDLAAALYRKRTYDFDKCIYVVGTPQALHFQQVFNVLKIAGFEWYKDCIHVGFGMVRFKDKKMATRSGDVILLEDLLNEAQIKALKKINEISPALENKEDVAKKVGIGAVIYTYLKSGRENDIVFSWDEMLNFEGESAPYVQYTYARGKSVLGKAGSLPENADYSMLRCPEEYILIKLLHDFENILMDAAQKYEPFIITKYITSVARAFNKFYKFCPVLKADEETKKARIHLTQATCNVIKTGFNLLGIEVPERM
ncbi:MAG: arginine--tRNA ligase [Clostridia bacterium]|nr:arginine--tRNA ligase [Clostridia bacterium]